MITCKFLEDTQTAKVKTSTNSASNSLLGDIFICKNYSNIDQDGEKYMVDEFNLLWPLGIFSSSWDREKVRYQPGSYLRHHPSIRLVRLTETKENLSGWSAAGFEPTCLPITDTKSATLSPESHNISIKLIWNRWFIPVTFKQER